MGYCERKSQGVIREGNRLTQSGKRPLAQRLCNTACIASSLGVSILPGREGGGGFRDHRIDSVTQLNNAPNWIAQYINSTWCKSVSSYYVIGTVASVIIV